MSPASIPSGWLTQDQIADRLAVPLSKVRPVVAALHRLDQIQTLVNPRDNRFLLVKEDDLALLSKALGVENHFED